MSGRRILKYIYPDVILRTSIYPSLLGFAIALIYGYNNLYIINILNIPSWLVYVVAIVGIVAVQGLYEHGLDILYDRGGYSAFRDVEAVKYADKMVRTAITTCVLLCVFIVLSGRWVLIPIGFFALWASRMYVRTHNEWYATFGFQLSYSVGYFSCTNLPTPEWFIGAVMVGFIYKAALAMYRLDDYLGLAGARREFPRPEPLVQYYRNIMRYMLHQVPLLVLCLLLCYLGVLCKIIATIIAIIVTLRFWKKHHACCNMYHCKNNPLKHVQRPR